MGSKELRIATKLLCSRQNTEWIEAAARVPQVGAS
jgi:hypothetical protein